jgi:glycosyltransferase involved in cell wall biosynthesis
MLTIVQAGLFRAGSDRGLHTSIAFMRAVLRAGDAFSGCGIPQRDALVGELAMCGRLNRHTFGYELAHAILPAVIPPPAGRLDAGARPGALRAAQGIGADDFVVLWCGGYNTWTDVDTLFRGIELAMDGAPRVHYVSLGASTYTAADNTYERLRALIERSPHRDRFHLLGWRPWSEMPGYYAESDVGINIDARHYETTFGTRTRLVEMIAAQLPLLTTEGTELSRLLREHGAALTFPIGDAQALAAHVVGLASDPERGRRLAAAARACAEQTLSCAATTGPLRAWVREPTRAPDKRQRPRRLDMLQHRLRTVTRLALWRAFGQDK